MSLTSESGEKVDSCLPKLKSLKGEDVDKINGYKNVETVVSESNNMRALYKLATTLKLTSNDTTDTTNEWFYGVYIPYDVRLQSGNYFFPLIR